MRLAWRLMLAVGAVLLLAFVLDGILAVSREESLFADDMRRDARLAGKTLSTAMATARAVGALGDGELGTLHISDADERVQLRIVSLAGGEPAPVAPLPFLREKLRWRAGDGLEGAGPEKPTDAAPDGEIEWTDVKADRLFVYVPLDSNRSLAVEMSESLAPLRAHHSATVRRAFIRTASTTAGVLLLVLVLGIVYVGRPVKRLAEMTRRIGAGDFSARAVVSGGNELAQLAEAMNAMTSDLALARANLEEETAKRIAVIEQLRHADRLATIGQLAAGVAHELGTPLTVVAGRAKDIAIGEVEPGEVAESARVIHEQSERMRNIIRHLLDLSRQRHASKSRADLADLLRKTVALIGLIAYKKRVEVLLEAEEPTFVDVDVGQLQQALTNLLMNAIQAVAAKGEVRVSMSRIRCTPPFEQAGAEGDYACVLVADNGPGIDPKHLPHVFEPFFTTKDVGEGTGLGLAVAYGLARENGGWIHAISPPGQGARFSLFIPLGPLSERDSLAAPAAAPAGGPS